MFLLENPQLMEEIDHKLRLAVGLIEDEDAAVGSPVIPAETEIAQ